MAALSPHYRDDKMIVIDPETQAYLDEHYLTGLKHLDTTNPKLLVVFSGGNAVGKSTLAAKIQERFGALVLENDELKYWIKQIKPNRTTFPTFLVSLKCRERLVVKTNSYVRAFSAGEWPCR